MNILIVSCEAWRDTNNGGNVLSNIFSAFPDADIAQIYCSGELPQNSICQKYFQISDSMLLTGKAGRVLDERDYSLDNADQQNIVENKVKSRIPKLLREDILLARELMWTLSNWKTKQLNQFIIDFQPDVIFAPCYSYFHVSKLALYVKSIAQCPMISYISDDNYSLKQLKISPSFWINRLITRKWIRRHFSACSFVYTMTETQKNEYEALLKRPMKVLCKSAEFVTSEKVVGTPIRFIYAGGLYLNRWKMLIELAKIMQEINRNDIKVELHVFSSSKISSRIEKKLNDGRNSFFHKSIPYHELMKCYQEYDVAVHVESFDLKNRLVTRLSFSTKIIDCMNSGCAILAIGPRTQAGISYLRDNDAAICVDNKKKMYSVLNELVNSPELIRVYSKKANELGKKNHNKKNIEKKIKQDFYDLAVMEI